MTTPLPIFSGIASDFVQWYDNVYALSKETYASYHPCGVLAAVFPPHICYADADWPHDASEHPIPFDAPRDAGPIPIGADSTAFQIWKWKTEERKSYLSEVTTLAAAIRASLGPRDILRLNATTTNPRGFQSIPAIQIVADMVQAHGVLSSDDLDLQKLALRRPYSPHLCVEDYVATMRNNFTLLTRHGHPVSPADQFAYLLHGIKDHPDFSMATQIYLTMQPTVVLRRFDGLAKALIDAHPSSATAPASPTAHSFSGSVSKTSPSSVADPVLVEAIAAAVLTKLNFATPNKTTSTAPKKDHRPTGTTKALSYCWTHGPNTTHRSGDCRNPAPGHQSDASLTNTMGGRAEPWKRPK